ncbi:MAG TPA: 50S ribosomal protein L14e [Candidatus Nanoarchaeia archaeon]|nr:50S ribosomal protein L14e [Candidatus Nanoarchaeia archaeon]
MIMEVGRLCVKLAGRDAGKTAVVVEIINPSYVLIDGAARRKKVNIKHLEPLSKIIELSNQASSAEVIKAFEKLGLLVRNTKRKEVAARPKKARIEKAVSKKGNILTKKEIVEKTVEKTA